MPDIAHLIQSGATNPWIYLPAAILLGALHALEPGHSKTLMAGFIVAIRGTPAQATLLGVSTAVGHTIIVWGLALIGLWIGDKLILDSAEPWLILGSGVLIVLLGLRLFFSIRRSRTRHEHPHRHSRGHGPDHDDHDHQADVDRYRSAPAAGGNVTPLEIAWFGFSGGLLPCPAAIAVLLVCLQLGSIALGAAMVAAFSVGLAITLVAVGIGAAWGARAVSARMPNLGRFTATIPYLSAAIVTTIGLVVTVRSVLELSAS